MDNDISKLKSDEREKKVKENDNLLFDIQKKLLEVWCEILDIDNLGIEDNFLEVGGHSLKAIELECIIKKEFNVDLSLEYIFKELTIKKLAKYIIDSGTSKLRKIETVNERDYYPISWSQEEMFIFNNQEGINTALNITFTKVIVGNLDVVRFEKAINKLIDRQEILRTSFHLIDDKPVQKVSKKINYRLIYLDAKDSEPGEIISNLIRPYDIAIAPLCRFALIKIENNKHIFVMDTHHIISDGYSINILLRELVDLYEGKTLSNMSVNYKDYAVWQNEVYFNSEAYKKAEKYWCEKISSGFAGFKLPSDYKRGINNEYIGEQIEFKINKTQFRKVDLICKTQGITIFTLILSTFVLTLFKHSRQNDILIGSISAGRVFEELNSVVGDFIRAIPMQFIIDKERTFREFLICAKEVIIGALDNQEYKFYNINRNYENSGISLRDEVFNVIINYHSEAENRNKIKFNDLLFDNYHVKNANEGYRDLQLDIFKNNANELKCYFEYNSVLFSKRTVESIIQHFLNILDVVTDDIDQKISNIKMLTNEEIKQLLNEFNNTDI